MASSPQSLSEKGMPLTLPCTRTEAAPVCQLVRLIPVYNELLWYVGLEIREENSMGELVIALAPSTRFLNPWADPPIFCEGLATSLLGNVFAHHHCIVAIDLNFVVARNNFLLSLLHDKCNVRKLAILEVARFGADVLDALLKLANPSIQNCTAVLERNFSAKLTLPVAHQEQINVALTVLDVSEMYMSSALAEQFIAMLLGNDRIIDLTVGAGVFTGGCADLRHGFATYLHKEHSVLKKLTVRTAEHCRRALYPLVCAIASTTTLDEAVIDIDIYHVEDKALFAEIIAKNRTLRKLSVTWTRNSVVSTIFYGVEGLTLDAATRIEPWLLAIPENTALSALTIDMLGFSEEECSAFFRALALNKSLKSVYIDHLPSCASLTEIFQIIRDSRLAKTVHFKGHHVSPSSLPMLPECPELTSLTISSCHLKNFEILGETFHILASCSHVTSLRICLRYNVLNGIQAAMAAYIAAARTLTDIEVHAYFNLPMREEMRYDVDSETILVSALASNLSLTRIKIKDLAWNEDNSKFLANAVVNSRNISELSFAVLKRKCNNAFVQTLVVGIENNRSLLDVQLPLCKGHDAELVVIRNVTRRNASLVDRAARFVMGDYRPYNACAVELVSKHEKVLNIVQENRGVGATEAAAMIKRSLNLLMDLDEYMKLVGVVKRSVVCTGRRCDGMQLDQLGFDCWILIRRFLTVADVVGTDRSVKL